MIHKQGIVSILGSDGHEKATKAAPLRRTLSADMSSKRWLAENGLPLGPALKKIASSEQIAWSDQTLHDSSSSSEDDEEECEAKGKGDENPRRLDIWTAIMSQKAQDESFKLLPPYVHPLVKKSASSLSEKSLKVCTESLGSETGSDVFSSYSSSKTSEDEKKDDEPQVEVQEMKEVDEEESKSIVKPAAVATTAGLTAKKAQQARSFPPPLPSLAAAHTKGSSLHMHSRRVDGRLVLEAVSVPPQKYFESQRQDGRFLLTLINNPKEVQASKINTFDEEMSKHNNKNTNLEEDGDGDENEIENDFNFDIGHKETRIFKERQPPKTTNGKTMDWQRSTVVIKKMTERDNRKLNTKAANTAKLEAVEEEEATPPPITQSLSPATGLPPLPPPAAATSFNSYQYFWWAKPTVASVIDPLITQHLPPTKTKDLVLLRGNKADCLLPSLKGCKEPRRSLLMWEPFCIATS